MSTTLASGGNVSLTAQSPGVTAVRIGVGWTAPPGYDLDATALLCGADGKVLSEGHFVFFNNLRSPDGAVRHRGAESTDAADREQIEVELTAVAAEVEKIVFPLSLYGPEHGVDLTRVADLVIRVTERTAGTELARFPLPPAPAGQSALLLGELYRRGAAWKFRAVGQGYAAGLAGIAEDFGVDVLREAATPASTQTPPAPTDTGASTAPEAPVPGSLPSAPEAVTATPSTPPTPADPSSPPPPASPASAPSQPPFGSPEMTCFFDPAHAPGTVPVTWSPQWGVPRQITACGECAQRVQTTPPPYYTPPQPGYPQPAGYPGQPHQGYPQPGPAPHGYPQQGPPQQGYPDQQGGGQRRFGMGAMVGAGAAGLVGGALLNEALSDDEGDVTINNYVEEEGE